MTTKTQSLTIQGMEVNIEHTSNSTYIYDECWEIRLVCLPYHATIRELDAALTGYKYGREHGRTEGEGQTLARIKTALRI